MVKIRTKSVCQVRITIERNQVLIEYPFGMSKDEFGRVLQRVASSEKRGLNVAQIGELGIGIFSVLQIGKKGTFISQKEKGSEQVSVTIREGSDKAEFRAPRKKERLENPGIKIIISNLNMNPLRARGPLSRARLQKVFAEKFNSYLRDGLLEIVVREPKGTSYRIEPLSIEFKRIGRDYEELYLNGNRKRRLGLELYYDPSGKGAVSIRHTGVTVINDIRKSSIYELEESVYTSGNLWGFIDADFLTPLAARTSFEENEDWILLISELERILPDIEAEIELLKEEEASQKLSEIQKRAVQVALEILEEREFQDLELLGGLREKRSREPQLPQSGFNFVPGSVRIDPKKEGSISLKVMVPSVVPEGSVVKFTIDNPSIRVSPKQVTLRSSNADETGIVAVKVVLFSEKRTASPAVLTAKAGNFLAKARVSFAKASQTREPKGTINYVEKPFEDGPVQHSRYLSGVIEVNTLNPDYKKAMEGTDQERMTYATLMILKETLVFNDKSGKADEFLERMMSFSFRLKKIK